ncbi:hypothetical protein SAMN02800694_3598 [Luteibacter sp. UNCMF331Sha3.1]|uniref:hypothetical protein n=1 Tax=Luteibacter sp. UNCMF331Sha3.1 TaxID=1502760 RepID=UPI0008B4B1FC|nr:hypothetical protein [Luteibacter sp. UNCMF331Sha3.1]SEN49271.1 hypothetical protein SAMN02800694_3598 [Luteibacter sp. UNCMF331Sha3.1]
MFRNLSKPLVLVLAMLLVAACNRQKDAPGTPGGGSPEDATRESLALLRDGKFDLFWRHALPPADFATLRADWPRRNASEGPLTGDDRAKFEAGVKRLTEPDAEKKLFADLRPTLVRFDRDYKDQMPLISGIGQSMALTAIEQAKDLTLSQKRQLREAVNIVGPWTQTVAWGDQAKAKTAIATVVDTARKANLSTADALHGMTFEQSMATWSTAWLGLKRLLDVYGLSVDQTFDSISIDTLEKSGGSAHVKITYTLLGKPIQTDATLVMLDGRWYDSDLLQRVRDEHARMNPPAAPGTAPARASTVVAPAGPVADARTR